MDGGIDHIAIGNKSRLPSESPIHLDIEDYMSLDPLVTSGCIIPFTENLEGDLIITHLLLDGFPFFRSRT